MRPAERVRSGGSGRTCPAVEPGPLARRARPLVAAERSARSLPRPLSLTHPQAQGTLVAAGRLHPGAGCPHSHGPESKGEERGLSGHVAGQGCSPAA